MSPIIAWVLGTISGAAGMALLARWAISVKREAWRRATKQLNGNEEVRANLMRALKSEQQKNLMLESKLIKTEANLRSATSSLHRITSVLESAETAGERVMARKPPPVVHYPDETSIRAITACTIEVCGETHYLQTNDRLTISNHRITGT